MDEALRLQVLAEDLKRQSEEANNKRNALLGSIDDSVKACRDLLLGVYRKTPKVLSEFGFDITDSVKLP